MALDKFNFSLPSGYSEIAVYTRTGEQGAGAENPIHFNPACTKWTCALIVELTSPQSADVTVDVKIYPIWSLHSIAFSGKNKNVEIAKSVTVAAGKKAAVLEWTADTCATGCEVEWVTLPSTVNTAMLIINAHP